ncbi:MAG: RluA family pseudouridine synthase [Christensenellales bacterium]|jgi:23S rRNA pseudouridine1911/1915/1917 synthase
MTVVVSQEDVGKRLDAYVAEKADVTRSRAIKLIEDGHILIDGEKPKKAGIPVKSGMSVSIDIPAPTESAAQPQDIHLNIVYQDDDLAVVYKPSGMVVHPAAGNPDGTMVNALLYHLSGLSGIGGETRPGIVHRIDKDTSGLLLVAKNDRSHIALSEQIKAHSVCRAYLAILAGAPKADEGYIDMPIGRHPTDRKKMAIVQGGREAQTNWRVLERLSGACLVEARLNTGRTHQIRVHMASIGHPVLGDVVYGAKRPPFRVEGGQLLHAYRIGFVHPTTGREMLFEAEPEPRFLFWLEKLRSGR